MSIPVDSARWTGRGARTRSLVRIYSDRIGRHYTVRVGQWLFASYVGNGRYRAWSVYLLRRRLFFRPVDYSRC